MTRVVHVNDNLPGAVYIGRRMPRKGCVDSIWGNPFKIGRDGTRAEVLEKYRAWFQSRIDVYGPANLNMLRGKALACWCRHDGEERTDENTCHGDVLIELLEETQ